MKNKSQKIILKQKIPIYTKLGLAIIVICGSINLFNPGILLEGTVTLVIGLVFIVINIINLFRRVEYDVVAILVGLYFLIIGADAFFSLEISYIPIITIILMIPVVILSLKSFYKS